MTPGQTLYVRLASNVGQFQGQMATAAGSVLQFGAAVDTNMSKLATYGEINRRELESLGSAAGKYAVVATVALGLAGKAAVDWQSDWTGVLKTVEGSDTQLSSLEGTLRGLTKELPSSHTEIANVAQAAGQLGVAVPEIAKFTETMINLGTSTNLSADDAAIALSRFNYVMGLSNENVDALGSTLVALGNTFPTTEAEITEMSSRLAASGKIAGLSADEVMGFSAALTSVGVGAESGGTAFSKVFMTMRDAVIDGGEELDVFADAAGMSAAQFQASFGDDAAGTIDSFIQGLAKMSAEGESTTAVFDDLGLSDQRLMRAVLSLGQAGPLTARALKAASQAIGENSALTEESAKFNETASARMKRSWNGVKDNMIGFGRTVLPVLAAFASAVDVVTDGIGLIPAPMQAAVITGLALTAMLAAGGWAASKFVRSLAAARTNIQFLEKEAWRAAAGVTTMNKAMMFRNAARGAALIAGMTLATTGLGDSLGIANTAQYGLMGAMLGPWGAAAGVAVGLFMDIKGSADQVTDSMRKARGEMLNLTKLDDLDMGLDTARAQFDSFRESQLDFGNSMRGMFTDLPDNIATIFGGGAFRAGRDEMEKTEEAAAKFKFSIQKLNDESLGLNDGFSAVFDARKMQEFADKAGPVLEDVGLDIEKVINAGPDGENWDDAVAAIENWKTQTDTAAGRADALGGSLSEMDDDLVSAGDSADDLSDKLDNLFSPALDYDKAVIAWHESLRALKEELGDGAKTLDINTEAGEKNRSGVISAVETLNDQVVAAANAGKGAEELAAMMDSGRQSIIDQGTAVGFNEDAMVGLLDQYNLTPDLIETLVEQIGAEAAGEQVDATGEKMNDLDTMTANPTVRVGGLSGALNGLQTLGERLDAVARLRRMANLTSTPATEQADGGFHPFGIGYGMTAAANGLYSSAKIHRAGAPLVKFAEPETQGESYIPHAMSKRSGSTKILNQTAAKFGYDLAPRGMEAANGGGRVIVQQAAAGPLIGSLTVPAMSREDAIPSITEVMYQTRKIERGGRWT